MGSGALGIVAAALIFGHKRLQFLCRRDPAGKGQSTQCEG